MVMVVQRGDATGVLFLCHTLVSYSLFHYVVLCTSKEKMVVNTCGSQIRWLKIVRKLY
jgi:hypothetical protein